MTAREKAENWLNAKNIDDQSRKTIEHLLSNDSELEESFQLSLEFGTGGLRGIMGMGTNRMNKYTVGMATQGFCNYLKQQKSKEIKVAIAYDSRNNSSFFAETASQVFSANGISVYLFEALRPTPELSFAIRHLGCDGGLVITASHNPKEYNGYKAYWDDGGQIVPPHDKNIIAEVQKIASIDDVNFDSNNDLIHPIGKEIDEHYLQMISGLSLSPTAIQNQKDLKIVYSSIHGTGITLVPQALARLGFENVDVVSSQEEPDGNFPTVVYPNPEEKEAMSHALATGEKIDADLILATDPDADRVGIAVKNSKGEFQLLNGNQTGALIIYYLLQKYSEKGLKGNEYVAKTIVTSELIKEIADSHNVPCYNTLTGFKWIADLIRNKQGKEVFIGGGEESYGYLIGEDVRDKDAVASSVIIAEIAAWAKDQGMSLFELLLQIYDRHGFYYEQLASVTRKGLKGADEIRKMMEKFRSTPPKTLGNSPVAEFIDYQAGTKTLRDGSSQQIDFPRSNVLQFITESGTKISVRPSGTEPKIKFYFSLRSDFGGDYFEQVDEVQPQIAQLMRELDL